MKQIFITMILCQLFTINSSAQLLKDLKKAKEKVASITVDKLSRDPVTTSFKDVDKKNIQAETFATSVAFANIHDQPFNPEQGFSLQPGFYEGTFHSFCIKAGTYMPTKGSGRFYAELKGPKADIFETILDRIHNDRTIDLWDTQILIWAIIAKADFQKMSGSTKQTALKILSPQQIARLSKGSLDAYGRKKMKELAYKSDALKAVIEAENQIRQKLYAGVSDYAEYEAIAMRAGVDPIVAGFEAGKWSKHPDGYYIRYYSSLGRVTTTQIYVPEESGTIIFNAEGDIAVPANTSSQRLLQTNLPYGDKTWSYDVIENVEQPRDSEQERRENYYSDCSERIDPAIDKAIRNQMIMQNLPGVSVIVFRNGEVMHRKAYGYRNVIDKEPLTLNAMLDWASISKSVTAVAAMQMHLDEDIDFNIQDLVTKHCDYWPTSASYTAAQSRLGIAGVDNRLGNIRLRHLLMNTSGINQYGSGNAIIGVDTIQFVSLPASTYTTDSDGFNAASSIGRFSGSVLGSAPGTRYRYTSYGFNLLGAAIEESSPNGYIDWVQKNIAEPADMSLLKVLTERNRDGHRFLRDGILDIHQSYNYESVLPGGGWESTICDLAKYAMALSNGEFFDESQISMWDRGRSTTFTNNDGSIRDYYGFGVKHKGTGTNLRVWHGGKHDNLRSFMHFFPSDNTGVVVISPAVYADLPRLTRAIYRARGLHANVYDREERFDTPSGCEADMRSGDNEFTAIWRKTQKVSIVRTGLDNDAFYEEMKALRKAGYHCKDFEPFFRNKKLYWDGIFQKGIPEVLTWRNANKASFVSKCTEMRNKGYLLFDLEIYEQNGKKLYSGLFRKKSGSYAVRLDRTLAEFDAVRAQEQAKGRALIDLEMTLDGNTPKYNAVFANGEKNKLFSNMNKGEYGLKRINMGRDGYHIVDVEHYYIPDKGYRYAAIWSKESGKDYSNTVEPFCTVLNNHAHYSELGYELIDWERSYIDY